MSKQCSEEFKERVRGVLRDSSLIDLQLDQRTHNSLKKGGIETILELIRWLNTENRKHISQIAAPTEQIIRARVQQFVDDVRAGLLRRCHSNVSHSPVSDKFDADAFSVSSFPVEHRDDVLRIREQWDSREEHHRRLGSGQVKQYAIPQLPYFDEIESDERTN